MSTALFVLPRLSGECMELDAQPAESSPAPVAPPSTPIDQAVASGDIAAFREARRAERSGKPVSRETPPADPSPAEPAEQAASTDATPEPASEAGKPRKNAETRVQELLAERARERDARLAAERELAELRARQAPDAKPAAPSPAPVEKFQTYDEYLKANPDASYEDYIDARTAFNVRQEWKAAQAEQAEVKARQTVSEKVAERDAQWRARIEEAKKADPAFMDSLSEDVKRLKPFDAIRDAQGRWTGRPTGYHAIAEEILASPVSPQLMRHFSDHPEDLHRIAGLLPAQLLKEMGKLENRFEGAEKPAPVAPKTVSSAPPPPTILGTKPSAPGDPMESAVAANDVAAFRAARQRARLASLR